MAEIIFKNDSLKIARSFCKKFIPSVLIFPLFWAIAYAIERDREMILPAIVTTFLVSLGITIGVVIAYSIQKSTIFEIRRNYIYYTSFGVEYRLPIHDLHHFSLDKTPSSRLSNTVRLHLKTKSGKSYFLSENTFVNGNTYNQLEDAEHSAEINASQENLLRATLKSLGVKEENPSVVYQKWSKSTKEKAVSSSMQKTDKFSSITYLIHLLLGRDSRYSGLPLWGLRLQIITLLLLFLSILEGKILKTHFLLVFFLIFASLYLIINAISGIWKKKIISFNYGMFFFQRKFFIYEKELSIILGVVLAFITLLVVPILILIILALLEGIVHQFF